MSSLLCSVSTLGVPRIGPRPELKFALESYWSGKTTATDLLKAASDLRAANWARQRALGVNNIPSNDFSLYDHVLDTAAMVGAIPERYDWKGGPLPIDTYFAMARGSQGGADAICGHDHGHDGGGNGVPALEMTKWFDTNYHYMVPEFGSEQDFTLAATKPVDEYLEAKALGYETRPVILGPVTFLKLGKTTEKGLDRFALLSRLMPVYEELMRHLQMVGVRSVQLDEPALALDLTHNEREALRFAVTGMAKAAPGLKIMLTSYFGGLGDNLDLALSLPVAGVHLDLVRAPDELEVAVATAPKGLILSLGVIDGRNVWRANLPAILDHLEPIVRDYGADHIEIASSCSMLHVPIDLTLEEGLDQDVASWLAFSVQKIEELDVIARALREGRSKVHDSIEASKLAAAARASSSKVHDAVVAARMASTTKDMSRRRSAFAGRAALQKKALGLPLFPTTTIGSFPQTQDVRKARSAFNNGSLDFEEYETFLRTETAKAVRWQEEIDLDVLVHGEFERNDMVQYFGERLSGFAFTKHAWVQSYGSRYVRPPILFGDVSRPEPMTVDWWRYAQSLTARPMKGMLTGPVTILNWSFVRDDIQRFESCRQIGLAIRDEVCDLEAAGAKMIQIDEAALREGLPLHKADWRAYLGWAVDCFRLCTSGVSDETQIHTHMCYSKFNDIIASIAAMDADVISVETSRSRMELLDVFRIFKYPNQIGPGVYDIHSPRVPDVEEMTRLLTLARERLSDGQLWVNPDCGLKTRKWEEVRPALENMVEAARRLRTMTEADP
ncbi:5-methyltetrahydropteroyltriglutamate--homocysteine S-methyltransferase [Aurantimonas sp. C2-6-R+9]|uniref:5-methyltetrahydropteroyltriglutamate-- homocysteine S-methyltransferase n=1 Tax=unclassified Aurantimonas TaxID=2638230 RepID=UPI002E1998AB|nr:MULTISPECIES: 5-methyltetrahydropteroyltriglutamate--homocysteine S-methyltransferase [unclassified Aurantimonas]MEC5293432.1 5-methyltetrahydropteroyltriglutamate--homocysteine S-methyltransferase [Aurantimonas sp. C2-3-R2]MEC5383629.1 5-methyltetrahydropteroyltriglutamate--homocysteine S-methyltransferase [Aurantimonas sp. C2-6-R+9]MEC5414519.1 5-methyltetrahydropteroyltriglutamate--homocysteine S-methyltransferase [Aurantimonas sp. C2-4-R8]